MTKYYQAKDHDRRLVVSQTEFTSIITKLTKEAKAYTTRQEVAMWDVEPTQCVQRTKTGMIPYQISALNDLKTTTGHGFSQGGLSQEIGVPEPSPGAMATPVRNDTPRLTGHWYNDHCAYIAQLASYAEKDKEIANYASKVIKEGHMRVMRMIETKFPANPEGLENSEFIDSMGAHCTESIHRRKRAAGEVRGKSKKRMISKYARR